jgi:AcrR family transcriptional regulator
VKSPSTAKADPVEAEIPSGRLAGIAAFARRRKQENRDQLLAAGVEKFSEQGYHSVSIDDIANAAGVSRMTFYRHFSSKADLLVAIFNQGAETGVPRLLRLCRQNFRDSAVVRSWIADIFERNRSQHPQLLLAFSQATKIDPEFVQEAQKVIGEIIAGLGEAIPAFAVAEDSGQADRQRWLEAWLLLYDILDQSNQAAVGLGMGGDPLMIDVLTSRFMDFLGKYPQPAPALTRSGR